MPMNPRLLRPTEGGFRSPDADARAYLAAVRQADGANLEPAVAKAISDFVIGCKTDGIWNAIKASCILAGARTLSGALTPLKGSAPTNDGPFVSGDYTRGGATPGLKGNASTKFLNSNRANNADPQDNHHLALWVSVVHSGTFCNYAGAGGTATGATALLRNTATDAASRSRTGATATALSSAATNTGLFGISRSASGSYTHVFGAASATVSVASQTPSSGNVFIFGREQSGSVNSPTDGRLAFYSLGESLDLALLGSRLSTLMTAIGAAIP
jgi:hypothetical protein